MTSGVMLGALRAIRAISESDQKYEAARGSAIESSVGRDLSSIYEGRAPFEAAWMKERKQSDALAEKKREANRWYDRSKAMIGLSMMAHGASTFLGAGVAEAYSVGTASPLAIPAGLSGAVELHPENPDGQTD